MAKLMAETIHEYHEAMYWDHPYRQNGGGTYLYKVPGEGIIIRNSAASPTVIVHKETDPEWPIESGFEVIEHVEKLYDWKDIHVVQDSDEIMMAGLEFAKFGAPDYKLRAEKIFQSASVLREANTLRNLPRARSHLVEIPMRWHWEDLGESWYEHENKFTKIIEKIFICKNFLEEFPEVGEDLKRNIILIDTMRQKKKNWLELFAKHESLIDLMVESEHKTELMSDLCWLHACEGNDEKSLCYFEKVLKLNFEGQIPLCLELLSMHLLTQRAFLIPTYVNKIQDYLVEEITTDIKSGWDKAKKTIDALIINGQIRISDHITTNMMNLVEAIKKTEKAA